MYITISTHILNFPVGHMLILNIYMSMYRTYISFLDTKRFFPHFVWVMLWKFLENARNFWHSHTMEDTEIHHLSSAIDFYAIFGGISDRGMRKLKVISLSRMYFGYIYLTNIHQGSISH